MLRVSDRKHEQGETDFELDTACSYTFSLMAVFILHFFRPSMAGRLRMGVGLGASQTARSLDMLSLGSSLG